jgi:uncharacterized repeat protein (TIGR02543 family)
MKKALYVLLAALTIIGMVSCGGGGGGGDTRDEFTVTFYTNGGNDIAPVTVKEGDKLTRPADPVKNNWDFDAWYTDAELTTEFDFATPIDADLDLYAGWAEKEDVNYFDVTFYDSSTVFFTQRVASGDPAIVPSKSTDKDTTEHQYRFKNWYVETAFINVYNFTLSSITANTSIYGKWSELFKVIFELSGADLPSGQTTNEFIVEDGEKVASIGTLAMVASYSQLSPEFKGWYKEAAGTTAWVFNINTITANTTIYSKWDDPAIIEETTLVNGWTVIYKFELPAGKKWSDYKSLTAEYLLTNVSTAVRARVFGNFTAEEVAEIRLGKNPSTGTIGEEGTTAIGVVGTWPGGSSGRWIMSRNDWAGPTAANEMFSAFNPQNNKWFTVDYGMPGPTNSPHAQWNGGVFTGGNNANPENALTGRVPVAADTGPFYLGVGLTTGGGTAPIVSQIKNVVLVGYDYEDDDTDTANLVIGVPLYLVKDGVDYRAYNGQLEKSGALEGGNPGWKLLAGEDKFDKVDYVALPQVNITLDPNWPAANVEADPAEPAPVVIAVDQGDTLTAGQLAAPGVPKHTDPTKAWIFKGWNFTETGTGTGAGNVSGSVIFRAATTIYAQWEDADAAKITFDVKGATGTKDDIYVAKEVGTLSITQLTPRINNGGTITDGIDAPDGKTFGGWYTVDTAGGSFAYNDYSKLVTHFSTFTADTTVYAYWFTKPTSPKVEVGEDEVELKVYGGGAFDVDGWIIFGGSEYNAYYTGNANDSAFGFDFPFTADTTENANTKVNVTYEIKIIAAPSVGTNQSIDTAFALKRAFNSWDGLFAGGSYASFNQAGGTITRQIVYDNSGTPALNYPSSSFGCQINKGTDGNQIRTGVIYGVKITGISFTD